MFRLSVQVQIRRENQVQRLQIMYIMIYKEKITGIIDDGATRIGVESTVLDLSDPTAMPMILRPGAVTKEQIEAVIESPVAIDQHLVKENETPKAPGMKYKHYSPDTRVLMVRDGDWSTAVQWAKIRRSVQVS